MGAGIINQKNQPGFSAAEPVQPADGRFRWLAVSVFLLSSVLNYLDRNLLNILAPLIMAELHFNQTRLGVLISVFSISYAVASLGTGWMLDRFGINKTVSGAVGWWSLSAVASGLVHSFGGLAVSRAALGVGESAGISAVGKLNGIYLLPKERALGAAANQIGLSLGAALAPLWIGLALARGWRLPMMINGAAGFVWIPLWLFVSRRIRPTYPEQEIASARNGERKMEFGMFRERNLLVLVAANMLWMGGYALWSQWTTLYLMHVHGLTLKQAGHYVWIPPIASNIGGFFGGWLSLRAMRDGINAVPARRRAIWISALCSLLTLLLPFSPNAEWTTFGICVSFFFALAGSVNIYALPIDIFGPERSGLALAALTFAFGVLQMIISPVIGWMGDHQLYKEVVWIATVPLLASAGLLMALRTDSLGSGDKVHPGTAGAHS